MTRIGILAVLLCVGIFSACGSSPESVTSSSEAEPLSVTAQVYDREFYSEDSKLLLGAYHYVIPHMNESSENESDRKTAQAFNKMTGSVLESEMDSWVKTMENAQTLYSTAGNTVWGDGTMHWNDEISYDLHQMEKLISLRFKHGGYVGGAHNYSYYENVLFSLAEGRKIELQELTDDPEELELIVAEEILDQIEESGVKEDNCYWDDYDLTVLHWMQNDYGVYFGEEQQLEIIFPAYELACYAAGPQSFTVDKTIYESYLNDYGRDLLAI